MEQLWTATPSLASPGQTPDQPPHQPGANSVRDTEWRWKNTITGHGGRMAESDRSSTPPDEPRAGKPGRDGAVVPRDHGKPAVTSGDPASPGPAGAEQLRLQLVPPPERPEPPVQPDNRWISGMVDQLESPLVRYAYRLIGDRERAMDVVQEAFLKLCNQSREKRLKIQPHVNQWLYTVTRNGALNVIRKESRMFQLADGQSHAPSQDRGPQEQMAQNEATQQAMHAITQLPDNQRECIVLKFEHGMSYRQISGVTGLTTSYVGYLIHAGLKSLRQTLGVPEAPKPAKAPRKTRATKPTKQDAAKPGRGRKTTGKEAAEAKADQTQDDDGPSSAGQAAGGSGPGQSSQAGAKEAAVNT